MSAVKAWIAAARPRTLPLALASILMGSFLASYFGGFRWSVLGLACLTTIFLQILSNLANDYGDSVHGADSEQRQGPQRAVQSGQISLASMKNAMKLFGALSFIAGIVLLLVGLGLENWPYLLGFLLLGLLCIWAAIAYTATDKPYGYAGLGDISVFVFFGLVGVLGTFFLHTGSLEASALWLACTSGAFATGVLNINNIRDISSDEQAGKRSIPVRMGRVWAVRYHWALLLIGFGCASAFTLMNYKSMWQWAFLLLAIPMLKDAVSIASPIEAEKMNVLLKKLAISTLLFTLVFGLGLVFS